MTATTDSTRMSWTRGSSTAKGETQGTSTGATTTTPLVPAPARSGWATTASRHRALIVAADLASVAVAGAAGVGLVSLLGVSPLWALSPLMIIPGIALCGGYRRLSMDRAASNGKGVALGTLAALLTLFVLASLAGQPVSPWITFLLYPLAAVLAVTLRIVLSRRLQRRRRNGFDLQRAVIIGALDSAQDFVVRALRHPEDGLDIVGQVRVPRRQGAGPLPFLGSLSEIEDVVAAHEIDVVIVVGALAPSELRKLSWALATSQTDLFISPGLAEVGAHRISVLPTVSSWNGSIAVGARPTRAAVKTVIDRTIGFAMLAVAAPIIGVIALIVRLTSDGGAFYSQTRVGKGGEHFLMWKIRSMYKDADQRRAALLAQNDGDGIIFKQKNDPRITPVGRIIRRYSLDELPQLWNVVRGDMSLIGPRPALPEEVAQYDDLVRRRLMVMPGLTGLWQVSGRSNLSWERSVELDLRYVDNHTLAMDAKIMAATGSAVFGASGAY